MTDSTFLALPTQSAGDVTMLNLVGVDPSKAAGAQDRKINAAQMLTAFFASHAAGGGSDSQHMVGVTAAAGGYTDSVLYTPTNMSADVCLLSVEIAQATIAVVPYHFQIYAGVPSGSGVLLYDSAVATGVQAISSYTSFLASSLYLPVAAGSTTIYLRVYNVGTQAATYSYQAVGLEFVGNGIVLPAYVTPPPYLGPLLSVVHVGASEQFAEPRYGLQALADGGTMYIDDGHYYLPIGFANPTSGVPNTIANYGGTSAHDANRFTHATIIGNSAYGTILDGRGGYGVNGLYRLTQGKGMVWTAAQLTLSHLHFINGGGADGKGDGEAGLYFDNVSSTSTQSVSFCAFDGNENGIFCAPGHGGNGNSSLNTVNITSCDFSFVTPNGQSNDGLSHNFYLDGIQTNVSTSNFYGCLGNTIKNRGPGLAITNSYVESGAGRAIDMPAAGTISMTGGTLCAAQSANSPFLGYGTETVTNTIANPQFTNVNVLIERSGSVIWPYTSGTDFVFTSCPQSFVFPGTVVFTRINSQGNSDPSCVTGLVNSYDGSVYGGTTGGTLLSVAPAKPGSIAQPGYTP